VGGRRRKQPVTSGDQSHFFTDRRASSARVVVLKTARVVAAVRVRPSSVFHLWAVLTAGRVVVNRVNDSVRPGFDVRRLCKWPRV